MVRHKLLVDCDDEARRLVWSIVEGPLGITHHNASAQVFPDGSGTRFGWIADVLPDEVAGPMGELMATGIAVVKRTMEAQRVS